MKRIFLFLFLCFCFNSFGILYAEEINSLYHEYEEEEKRTKHDIRNFGEKNKILFTLQYNQLFSTMNEYLYSEDWSHKNSQLDHVNKYISVATIGLEFTPFLFYVQASVGMKASFTVSHKSGKYRMDDYDWTLPNTQNDPLTHHSWHTEGKYKYVNLDLYGKIRFFKIGDTKNFGSFNFYALLGFRFIESSAIQHGMSYFLYADSSSNPLAEYYETNNDVDGLKYRQRMWLPYYGLAVEYRARVLSVILTFKNSFLNKGTTYDAHYLRDMYSRHTYRSLFNYSLSLNIGCWLTDNFRIFIEAGMNRTDFKRAEKGRIQQFETYTNPYNGSNSTTEYRQDYKFAAMKNFNYSFGGGLTIGF